MDYEKLYKDALSRARAFELTEYKNIMVSVFPELKESEDEKIRKNCIHFLELQKQHHAATFEIEECIAWLEKQGEHANFRNKIQVGDKVTRNEDGVLVNLSQLERVAKKNEKKGEQTSAEWHSEDEQNLNACLGYIPDEPLRRRLKDVVHVKYDKPVDEVKPKFKVGDWVIYNNKHYSIYQVEKIENYRYTLRHTTGGSILLLFGQEYFIRLWTIEDAKDGDVLCYEDEVFILKNYVLFHKIVYHCCYDDKNFIPHSIYSLTKDDFNKVHPAIKEQRAALFQEMKEAGYEWDAEKKELVKLE